MLDPVVYNCNLIDRIYLLFSPDFSYRVEMAIADDTAEGTFVWFDGVRAKLHGLRASEAGQMLVSYFLTKCEIVTLHSVTHFAI